MLYHNSVHVMPWPYPYKYLVSFLPCKKVLPWNIICFCIYPIRRLHYIQKLTEYINIMIVTPLLFACRVDMHDACLIKIMTLFAQLNIFSLHSYFHNWHTVHSFHKVFNSAILRKKLKVALFRVYRKWMRSKLLQIRMIRKNSKVNKHLKRMHMHSCMYKDTPHTFVSSLILYPRETFFRVYFPRLISSLIFLPLLTSDFYAYTPSLKYCYRISR